MLITIKNAPSSYDGHFSGMVYPKGLSKNSTCLSEYRFVYYLQWPMLCCLLTHAIYRDHKGSIKYKLPLRSCNTMPQETVSIKYQNWKLNIDDMWLMTVDVSPAVNWRGFNEIKFFLLATRTRYSLLEMVPCVAARPRVAFFAVFGVSLCCGACKRRKSEIVAWMSRLARKSHFHAEWEALNNSLTLYDSAACSQLLLFYVFYAGRFRYSLPQIKQHWITIGFSTECETKMKVIEWIIVRHGRWIG